MLFTLSFKGYKMIFNKPLAAHGLNSYRYAGRYGWIMIGAKTAAEALKEAQRSTSETVRLEGLQSWNGTAYAGVAK